MYVERAGACGAATLQGSRSFILVLSQRGERQPEEEMDPREDRIGRESLRFRVKTDLELRLDFTTRHLLVFQQQFTFLSLSFLICEMGPGIIPAS